MICKMPIQGRGLMLVKRKNFWTNIGTADVRHSGFDETTTPGDAGVVSGLVLPPDDDDGGCLLWDLMTSKKNYEFRLEMDEGGVYTISGFVTCLQSSFSITISNEIQKGV